MQSQNRFRWLGLKSPERSFLGYVGLVTTWRLLLATALGGSLVLVIGRAAHSSVVGYGYGGAIFLVLSWPLLKAVFRSLKWTHATVFQTMLLVIASLAMGEIGQRLLGFNPQSARIHHLNWPQGQHLLWQFPLVLPIENLVLLGGLVVTWQIVGPRSRFERLMVGIVAAFAFGFWHVPAWGGWTMLVIGLTVLPWTLYLLATGDMVVPVLAHIVMDTMAVIAQTAPPETWARRMLDPFMLLGLLLLGLGWSLYRDWRVAHPPIRL